MTNAETMEGKVYLCSWQAMGTGVRAWVTGQPAITVEAATFAEAREELAEAILDALGDGEATLDFDPPPPRAGGAAGERGILWSLGAQEMVRVADPASYYEGGLCDHCLQPVGPRTERPLELMRPPPDADMAMVLPHRLGPPGVGPQPEIVSEKFLTSLTPAERSVFEWREVVRPPRSRGQAFYEIIHLRPTVPLAVPVGREAILSRCESCGFEWIHVKGPRQEPNTFVSVADLPSPLPPLLAIDSWTFASLVVPEARYRHLVRTVKLRQVKGDPVILLDESAVNRTLEFQPRPREQRAPPR